MKFLLLCLAIIFNACQSDESLPDRHKRWDIENNKIPDTSKYPYDYNTPYNVTGSYRLHSDLADCKIYLISSKNLSSIFITRCPNSNTSTMTGGKHSITTSSN